jgi:glycosyltransferase involved in cell wall biosynthesis
MVLEKNSVAVRFSVIIPVYNVEKYLNKCLNSVLNQEYEDFEIILINDGSIDSSLEICDEFAKNNECVEVISQENQGLSISRNVGLKHAKGVYILFLDSDDYWDSSVVFADLDVEIEDKTEVVLYGNKEYNCITGELYVKSSYTNLPVFELKNKETIISYLFNENLFPGAAWKMAIRKDFLIKNNIIFEKGIKAEDIDWLVNVFSKVETIKAIKNPFYVYLKNRPESITFTADLKSIAGIYFAIDKWQKRLESKQTTTTKWLLNYLVKHYYASLIIYSKLEFLDKKKAYQMIRKRKSIIKYSKTKKNILVRLLIGFLGLKKTANLISYIYFKKQN